MFEQRVVVGGIVVVYQKTLGQRVVGPEALGPKVVGPEALGSDSLGQRVFVLSVV